MLFHGILQKELSIKALCVSSYHRYGTVTNVTDVEIKTLTRLCRVSASVRKLLCFTSGPWLPNKVDAVWMLLSELNCYNYSRVMLEAPSVCCRTTLPVNILYILTDHIRPRPFTAVTAADWCWWHNQEIDWFYQILYLKLRPLTGVTVEKKTVAWSWCNSSRNVCVFPRRLWV